MLQGDIYILSALDREKKDHYTLTAVARDNPGDVSSNRRENSVQVGLSSSHHPSRGGHQQEGVKPQAFLPSELAGGSRRNWAEGRPDDARGRGVDGAGDFVPRGQHVSRRGWSRRGREGRCYCLQVLQREWVPQPRWPPLLEAGIQLAELNE